MNSNPRSERLPASLSPRVLILGAAALALALAAYFALRPGKATDAATAYHTVKRGDFVVSFVEGGTLGAVNEVVIRNEVEGTARIISIVPEGSYAKKGDLLVELDSANAQDQVNQQQINYEKAKFAVEQAKAQLDIMRSATNSDFLAADLKLKFAKVDRQKYFEGQRLVDLVEASNKMVSAQALLAVNLDTYINSTNLAAKGYETKMKADGDRLSVLNTRNSLIVASNAISMLERFDVPKQLAKFDSDVLQAEQELARVVVQNKRKMAQYEADLSAQENTLLLSEQKLARDKKNLTATKVYAPQDGLVVYQVTENHFSSESLIEGGAIVRNRQELIKLPDLSRMKINVKVHESHVAMVRPGLPAYVVLDSMPNQRFEGAVEKVAPLPDTQARWGNPNLKVYNTEIYLTSALPGVKPGVSAKAEIVITNVSNTLSVPIYAVTTYRGKPAVYVANGGKTEPRGVGVGLFNTKFIEITSGLKEGEQVMLSPPMQTQEKDLEGGVLAGDEKVTVSKTNVARRTAAAPTGPAPGANGSELARPSGREGATEGRQGPPGFNREEMLKQYDKNGDGELDETERAAMREAMMARFGGQGGPGGFGDRAGGGRQGSRGGFNREEMLKQYDKNGDGELDETERAAMREAMGARFGGQGGPGGGPRMSREEMLKQFDKNGDGELDEEERAAMREARARSRTNAPPAVEGAGNVAPPPAQPNQ